MNELHSCIGRELTRVTMQAQSRDKVVVRSINKLINNMGPFHYVIDGLNVAYSGDATLSFNKVRVFVYCTTKLCVFNVT